MKAQLCLTVLLNVVVYHASATPTCSPGNGSENPEYYPHPTDCSKFLVCDWDVLIEQQCPPGIYWNDAIKACDFPENVDCDLPSTVSVTGKCPDEYDPSHDAFLPHVDCSKFYICTLQGPVEKNCPAGLHWNKNANVCDWPQIAGCTAGSANPPTTVPTELPSATTEPTSEPAPVGKCPQEYDPNHEVFLPHTDCSKYYHCTWNGRPVENSCPSGLDWHASANRCDWPAQAGCRGAYRGVSGNDFAPHVAK